MIVSRSNVDLQDMRRVLPPSCWMAPKDLEPAGLEEDGDSYKHGAYPQRFPEISVGLQEQWGCMASLSTTETKSHAVVKQMDWPCILRDLGELHADNLESDATDQQKELLKVASRASSDIFVDAHNTGYYINSYTTKLNPGMDNVLEKLLDGVRRLRHEWSESEEAKLRNSSSEVSGDKRKENFRKTVQVLSRFETCFRRASWKSGSEMVFPMLYGHLSFTTHRCWTVFLRRAMYSVGAHVGHPLV